MLSVKSPTSSLVSGVEFFSNSADIAMLSHLTRVLSTLAFHLALAAGGVRACVLEYKVAIWTGLVDNRFGLEWYLIMFSKSFWSGANVASSKAALADFSGSTRNVAHRPFRIWPPFSSFRMVFETSYVGDDSILNKNCKETCGMVEPRSIMTAVRPQDHQSDKMGQR
jgi:hypothetical protein